MLQMKMQRVAIATSHVLALLKRFAWQALCAEPQHGRRKPNSIVEPQLPSVSPVCGYLWRMHLQRIVIRSLASCQQCYRGTLGVSELDRFLLRFDQSCRLGPPDSFHFCLPSTELRAQCLGPTPPCLTSAHRLSTFFDLFALPVFRPLDCFLLADRELCASRALGRVRLASFQFLLVQPRPDRT